jgi:23S rRNA-/tRNA-specific pseudouridylate synthase
MHVTGKSTPGAQRAELKYRVLGTDKAMQRQEDNEKTLAKVSPCLPVSLSPHLHNVSLLEVRLLTGRKHQIRVQLSHTGFPILGDRKYGSRRPFPTGIALHSRRLVIEHPVSKMQLEIEAPLPSAWRRFVEVR